LSAVRHNAEGERVLTKKRYVVLFLAFLLVMTLVAVFGENGLIQVFKLKRGLKRLTETNEALRRRNAALVEEINYLRNHRGYLELQAHKLGLVKEGEIVFQFKEDR
jgi:cell division protein FtsB